ncbi:hypothetical protein [Comamonas thiooxydans]|uniref:hypothetical protein n=1 Tax=Comamonas thiooxydans TaxID=363952 RepID=UPI0001BB1799|nr:hypothetical protein [Comamonas thiooxydans]ACY32639.1 hypothetical protein CtCNB1_1893 [Comamonas thiooxydans]
MKFERKQPGGHKKLLSLQCDRCGNKFKAGSSEFEEFISIERNDTGEGSIFGHASSLQLDLCQYCLRDTLGEWLRVEEASSSKKAYQVAMKEITKSREDHIGPWVCPVLEGEAAVELLKRAGILTPTGRLTKQYRS